MAWETSNRREELPPNWAQLRTDQLRMDGFRCRWRLRSGKRCPRRATDVDHYGDKNDHTKLRSLCAEHHKRVTQSQAQAGRKKGSKARRGEEHPGVIADRRNA